MDLPSGISLGVSIAIGTMMAMYLQQRKNKKLAPAIETALRAQGAMTLPALAKACSLDSFLGRGKVVLALNDLVAQGKVRTIPAPDGTPQLQKVNFIKYALTG